MSNIEWTEETWNPVAGCSVVSPGCTNCYAMKLAGTRLEKHPKYAGLTRQTKAGPVWTGETRFDASALLIPLKRKKPTRYFVNSMSDLFAESVPDKWIDQIFAIMALCPQHEFQVLTKRAERMLAYFTPPQPPRYRGLLTAQPWARIQTQALAALVARVGQDAADRWYGGDHDEGYSFRIPLPNVWLGVSVEDQTRADERIPPLLDTPAAVRFISAEPLLGPLDLRHVDWDGPREMDALNRNPGRSFKDYAELDWVIVGGESGPDRRDMKVAWAHSLRDQCQAAGTPFFMKQMTGKIAIPPDLFIREWPKPTTKRGPAPPEKPTSSQLDLIGGDA